jgi:hypothetical protein
VTELDARRVREALDAARELTRSADARRNAGGHSSGRVVPKSPRARALLAEHLARLGLDAAAVEHELAAERAETRRHLRDLKAAAVGQSTERASALRRLVNNQRAALDGLTTIGGTTQYLTLDSPVEIWATDAVNLESSTIEPYNSRAKARRDGQLYHGFPYAILGGEGNPELLHFFYLWRNPQDDAHAIVTVNGLLTLNGFCSAHSRGGIVLGGTARLRLNPTLDLVQTWTQPISSAPPQSGQSQQAVDLTADSSGFYTDDQTTFAVEFRGFLLSYEQAIVPPGQYLIIDVALAISSETDNGEVSADFATGEFDVVAPLVQLAIVTPPLVLSNA